MNDFNDKVRRTIHIGGISSLANENSFANFFRQFGQITNVRLVGDKKYETQYGFIEFANPSIASSLVYKKDVVMDGKKLHITRAKTHIKTPYGKRTNKKDYRSNHQNRMNYAVPQQYPNPQMMNPQMMNPQMMNQMRTMQNPMQNQMQRRNGRPSKEERTVYISNFSLNTKMNDIIDFCRECGDITNYKFGGFDSNTQRRYALFEFYGLEGTNTCLSRNGELVGDSLLKIALAGTAIKSKPPQNDLTDAQRNLVGRTVHVSGIHVNASKELLYNFFSKCGLVEDVRIAGDATGKFSTRYAFIQFTTSDAAQRSLGLSGKTIGMFPSNRPIHVTFAREPVGRKKFGRERKRNEQRNQPMQNFQNQNNYAKPRENSFPQNNFNRQPTTGVSNRSFAVTRMGKSAEELGYKLKNYINYPTDYVFKPVYALETKKKEIKTILKSSIKKDETKEELKQESTIKNISEDQNTTQDPRIPQDPRMQSDPRIQSQDPRTQSFDPRLGKRKRDEDSQIQDPRMQKRQKL